MKRTTLASAVAVVVSALAAGVAHSDTVLLNNMTARWFEGNPAAAVTYFSNNTTAPYARWGDPASFGGQSGYNFVFATQPIDFTVPPSPSANDVLGMFTHVNFPIFPPSITDIKLEIEADVLVDADEGGPGAPVVVGSNLTFRYGFDHWETDNGARPCANGAANGSGVNVNGCADRVIAKWLSSSSVFFLDGVEYTLNVIGFSLDSAGTNPFANFWTAEEQTNNAYLVANVTRRQDLDPDPDPDVPEPGTLALIGLGLAGLAVARRRRGIAA